MAYKYKLSEMSKTASEEEAAKELNENQEKNLRLDRLLILMMVLLSLLLLI